MSDDHTKPARHPEGGRKDTSDLHDIKKVQDTGMAEKAKQVDQLPDDVTNTNNTVLPQQNR
ncbi:hypothetical protein [Deinococcus sp. QL22]|uniref:hypothetical protein n=1 Tax=Deinococcus sp. QL22 TaxID=2939437 RepID=UPI002018087B|nr:hypothetical protein [Deinococcus sp. QL22]UQN05741.1 hypothetical protein M1R55_12805 [Deinococcus sp. QL22]